MSGKNVPELTAPDGWRSLDEMAPDGTRSFVSGDPAGRRLRVRYFWNRAQQAFMARVWFGEKAEGPPGHAHGGSMAAVMDEAMGAAAWTNGHPSVAVQLTIDFREMLPLGSVATAHVWAETVDGRKISMAGRLESDDGTVYCESRGLFIEVEPGRFGRLSQHALRARSRAAKTRRP